MTMDIPAHIGIIMDGNRRWAKQRDMEVIEGHQAGFETLKETAEYALDRGVKELTIFAFSTENWRRAKEEVEGLFDLFRWVFKTQMEELHQKNIRVRILGSQEGVPQDLLDNIDKAEELTRNNDRGTLNVLFNYGGRQDIIEACRQLITKQIKPEDVDETAFSAALATSGMRDVDLLIRTTEYRLSGFLPWESDYAEIYFQPDILWPDFDGGELDKAIAFYGQRHRRFGK